MKPKTILIALLLTAGAALTPGGTNDTLSLTWSHPSLGQPETIMCTDPKSGQIIIVTNVVVTFFVYQSLDLTNWSTVAVAVSTNRATFPKPTQSAFFAVTESNSCEGETFFSAVAAWQPKTNASNLRFTKP